MPSITRLSPRQNIGSDLGAAIGQGFANGANFGLQKQFENVQNEQKATKEISSLQAALQNVNLSDAKAAANAILTAPNVGNELKKLALTDLYSNLERVEKQAQEEKNRNLIAKGFGGQQPSSEGISNQPSNQPNQAGSQAVPVNQPNNAQQVPPRQQPTITEAMIAEALLNKDHQLAKTLSDQRGQQLKQIQKDEERNENKNREKRKEFTDEREFETKRSDPILKENEQFKSLLPELRNNIFLLENAVGKTSVGDFIAEFLGAAGAPLRSLKGAQQDYAVKNYLLNDIQSLAGRPNQWIEQRMFSALPRFGQSSEANELIAAAEKIKLDVKEERSRLIDELGKEEYAQLGFTKGNILSRANELVRPYAQKKQNELAYRATELYEREDPSRIENLDKVPKGTILTQARANFLVDTFGNDAEQVAQDLGYTIFDPSEFERR